ncbi:MAG: hypothetical protein II932_00300, partial [Treponema sp.]|nr:hypothetical protein [Treponema sp.]
SASGIRVLDSIQEGSEALDAKELIAAKLGKLGKRAKPGVFAGRRNGKTEVYDEGFYDGFWKGDDDAGTGGAASALPYPGGGTVEQSAGGAAGGRSDKPTGGQAGSSESGAARRAAERKGRRASVRAARSAGKKGRQRIREALEAAVRPGS